MLVLAQFRAVTVFIFFIVSVTCCAWRWCHHASGYCHFPWARYKL